MRIDDVFTAAGRIGPAAVAPPEARGVPRDGVRLLVSRGARHEHAVFRDLPDILPAGTVLVVNTSATLPASLPASARSGAMMNCCRHRPGWPSPRSSSTGRWAAAGRRPTQSKLLPDMRRAGQTHTMPRSARSVRWRT